MAIANKPRIVIADEPTTALDVTIQAQILDVLQEAAKATGAALILITHDLGVIAEVADRVVVMYAGRAVEVGSCLEIFEMPRHPYTIGLLGSDPRHGFERGQLAAIEGQPPSLAHVPPGCAFHPRCFLMRERCATDRPALLATEQKDHGSACHYWKELRRSRRETSSEERSES
jgi:oligopeptide/dipeptide ABC transporter ATP-binding protein